MRALKTHLPNKKADVDERPSGGFDHIGLLFDGPVAGATCPSSSLPNDPIYGSGNTNAASAFYVAGGGITSGFFCDLRPAMRNWVIGACLCATSLYDGEVVMNKNQEKSEENLR